MYDDRILASVPGIALILISWLALIGRAIYRSRLGLICWNCGAAKVRMSEPRGVTDFVARLSLMFPFRCSGCRKRFYGFPLALADRSRIPKPVRAQ
jgi:hypothetical protein